MILNCWITAVEQSFKTTQIQFLLMDCYCVQNYKSIRKKYKWIRKEGLLVDSPDTSVDLDIFKLLTFRNCVRET